MLQSLSHHNKPPTFCLTANIRLLFFLLSTASFFKEVSFTFQLWDFSPIYWNLPAPNHFFENVHIKVSKVHLVAKSRFQSFHHLIFGHASLNLAIPSFSDLYFFPLLFRFLVLHPLLNFSVLPASLPIPLSPFLYTVSVEPFHSQYILSMFWWIPKSSLHLQSSWISYLLWHNKLLQNLMV